MKGDHSLKKEKIVAGEEIIAGKADNDTAEKTFTKAEVDELIRAEREQLGKKLAEAEKLAEMPADKRADYKRGQLEKQLAEREAAVAKRELMADAAEMLEARGLPKQLSLCLDYSGRENCEASIAAIGLAFENAVSASVNERLRGRTPKLTANDNRTDAFLDGLGM